MHIQIDKQIYHESSKLYHRDLEILACVLITSKLDVSANMNKQNLQGQYTPF